MEYTAGKEGEGQILSEKVCLKCGCVYEEKCKLCDERVQ